MAPLGSNAVGVLWESGADGCEGACSITYTTVTLPKSVRSKTDDVHVQRYEPGGWGAFPALTRHPSNASIWIAGSDVGGLFVTSDDAKTWAACNAGLDTKWVLGVTFLPDDTPLVATTYGVYRGRLDASAGPCLWRFETSNVGLRDANYSETMATAQ